MGDVVMVRTVYGTACEPTTPPSTPLPAGVRVPWQGQDWYLLGANLPWYNWGCDFGCGPNGGASSPTVRAALDSGFSRLEASGVNVARWWVFPGNPWQITRDASGLPTGINPAVYDDFDAALEVVGLRAMEIPTHPSDGLSLEGLQLALEQWPLKACVVVANHSNPMGARMPDERKKQMVSMLAAAGVPLIEDDIYGDLYHTGERPWPAKAYDRADNVIYCSSFSKTISPGLRLGWMVPGRHMAGARQQKYFSNLATSSIPQLAVAHFLEQGGYDRYLRSARQHYREATERLRAAVARSFPVGTAVSRPQGGFVLWVQLPAGVSGTRVYHRARAENINVAPGLMFSISGKFDSCLRLNGGNPWSARIDQAIIRLGALAHEELAQGGQAPPG